MCGAARFTISKAQNKPNEDSMEQPTGADAAGRDSDALGDPHAHAPGADGAKALSPPASEESSAIAAADAEIGSDASVSRRRTPSHDAALASDRAAAGTESTEEAAGDTAVTDADPTTCKVCRDPAAGDSRVCSGCGIVVHGACYAGVVLRPPSQPQSAGSSKRSQKKRKIKHDVAGAEAAEEADASGEWTCDCCAHGVAAGSELECVFCEQPSEDSVMKFVDTHAWGAQWSTSSARGKSFAHVLCSSWDPHAVHQQQRQEDVRQEKQEPEDEQEQPLLQQTRTHRRQEECKLAEAGTGEEAGSTASTKVAPPAPADPDLPAPMPEPPLGVQEPSVALSLSDPCCFCKSAGGIRIQCQRLDCGLFFHAMCAHQQTGRMEIRVCPQSPSLVEYHAYCTRHRDCAENAGALIERMLSKPVNSLTGRDAVLRLVTVKRRLESNSFGTIHAFFGAIVTVLTDLCKKGLKMSKTDPPAHNVKHLQALQFFLDHIPQLQAVYRAPLPRQLELGDNSQELYALLQKTFNPPRFLGKYAGPVSQVHACQVCAGPFHERQHLFYCSNPTTPHLQHWKCTKRRSTSREREKIAANLAAASAGGASSSSSSAKKKLTSISLVLNGQLCDVKLPKGLPGVSDGLICAICRCDVDACGLIASRKEGKRADFEKKSSDFVLGGCFANAGDLPKVSIISTMALPSAPGTKADTKQAAVSAATKSAATDRNRNKRSGVEHGVLKLTAVGSVPAPQDAAAAPAVVLLGPPKMEKIHVQRTTKWLAYVAQIIRLAGAVAKLSTEGAAVAGAPAAAVETSEKPAAKATPAPAVMATASQPSVPTEAEAPTAPATEQPSALAVAPVHTTPTSTASPEAKTVEAKQETLAKAGPEAEIARLSKVIDAYFNEAIAVVRPFDADAYVLSKLETARRYLRDRSGPAVGVLRMLAQEYTRIVYTKHTRAVEKAANEKRRRVEQEALEQRELARKRQEREAEEALKNQLQAMRQKKRKLVNMG